MGLGGVKHLSCCTEAVGLRAGHKVLELFYIHRSSSCLSCLKIVLGNCCLLALFDKLVHDIHDPRQGFLSLFL